MPLAKDAVVVIVELLTKDLWVCYGRYMLIPGQIGVPAVYSPMTRTLEDLEFMWKAIVSMKPWTYDYSVGLHTAIILRSAAQLDEQCLTLPWREVDLSAKKIRWGVMWDDGQCLCLPSPRIRCSHDYRHNQAIACM